jgi:plasmid stabilization system protein ParE
VEALHTYIAESSIAAADRQIKLVLSAVESLLDFPARGRPGRRRNIRELVVTGTPYLVAYRIRGSSALILTVLHGARRWPQSFSEE